MENNIRRAWIILNLLLPLSPAAPGSALAPCAPDSPGTPVSPGVAGSPPLAVVSSLVGSEVLLPCSCPALRTELLMQWCLESEGPVLEQREPQKWTTDELSDRAAIPESGPRAGNCSLVLKDLQVSDGGRYQGFLIQDQTKTGVFICSVKLLVFDHSSVQVKSPGEDLILDLHTIHATSLAFQDSNGSSWSSLWRKAGPGSSRVVELPLKEQLSLTSVSDSDSGVYKVLDHRGLTISTTRLRVEPADGVSHSSSFSSSSSSPSSSCPLLLLLLLLV